MPLATITAATSAAPASALNTVSYVDRIKPSGKLSIDALLAGGSHWQHTAGADGTVPSAAAKKEITFSFMSAAPTNPSDANGFAALTEKQRTAVRAALAHISTVIDVKFTETAAGSGDVQYGSNVQNASAGYARYPNDPLGGTVMLANNEATFKEADGAWSPGTYEWQTVLHETAHALGLKHPGNYNAGGGGTPGPYLPAAQDNRSFSIMSYKNDTSMRTVTYANGGFSSSYINASGFQAGDIAALQYLYGAAQPDGGGPAHTYGWATDQKLSQTIWDSSGKGVIDLHNQSKSSVIDLRAGAKSSIAVRDAYDGLPFTKAQFAQLKTSVNGRQVSLASVVGTPTYTGTNNLTIAAGSRMNAVIGGTGNETVATNSEADTIDAGGGDDSIFVTGTEGGIDGTRITGGAGNDTVYVRKVSGYTWARGDAGTLTLTQDATRSSAARLVASIYLDGVETVKFWNGMAMTATRDTPLSISASPARSAVQAYLAAA